MLFLASNVDVHCLSSMTQNKGFRCWARLPSIIYVYLWWRDLLSDGCRGCWQALMIYTCKTGAFGDQWWLLFYCQSSFCYLKSFGTSSKDNSYLGFQISRPRTGLADKVSAFFTGPTKANIKVKWENRLFSLPGSWTITLSRISLVCRD